MMRLMVFFKFTLVFIGTLAFGASCNRIVNPVLPLSTLSSVQSGCEASQCHVSAPLKEFPPTSGLHTRHLSSTKLDKSDGRCLNCHWNYANNPQHRNGQIDGFNAGAQVRTPVSVVSFGGKIALDDADVNGTFHADTASCSNISCHRVAAPAVLNWYVEPECMQCHQLGSGIDPVTTNGSGTSGKHIPHVQKKGIPCTICHLEYKTKPTHMNNVYGKIEEVNIVNIGGNWSLRKNIPGSFDPATGTCSPACHSSANWYTESRISCTVCHTQGNSEYAPDPWANGSHPKHLENAGIVCTDCHKDYPTRSTHFNGVINTPLTATNMINFDPSKNPAGSYNEGTCSSTMCHGNFSGGNVTAPTWGGTVNCTNSPCHGGANGSGNPASSLNPDSRHATHVNMLTTTINPATGLAYLETETCGVCHNGFGYGQSGHANAIIDISFNYPQAPESASAGNYSGGIFNVNTNNFNPVSCSNTYCHGNFAGGNTATVSYDQSRTDSNWCGTCHTTSPTSVKHSRHLTQYPGQCSYCHNGYTQSSTPVNHVNFMKNVNFGYPHPSGTTPVAPSFDSASKTCSGVYCHGNFPKVTYNGTSISTGKNFNPVWLPESVSPCGYCHGDSTNNNSSPTHGKHTATGSTYFNNASTIESCDACHNYGTDTVRLFGTTSTQGSYGTSNHANFSISATGVNADVNFKSADSNLASRLTTATPPATLNVSAVTSWNSGTTSCSNAWCHGNFNSGTGFVGLNAIPNWLNTTTAACGTCHAASSPTTNSHPKHVNPPYSFSCNRCHNGSNGHINGTIGGTDVNVSFDSLNPNGSYNSVTKKCSNLYCHGNGLNAGSDWSDTSKFQTNAAAKNNAPIWMASEGGGPGTVNCGNCHDATSSTMTTGSHTKHIGNSATAYNFPCRRCHASTFSGDTTTLTSGHANGTLDVAPDGNNPSGVFSHATNSCSSFYCHGNFVGGNSANTVTWNNSATGACGTCHDLSPQNSNYGMHDKHTNTNANSGYNFDCSTCHSTIASGKEGASPTLVQPLNTSLHANFTRNIVFSGQAVQGQSPVTANYDLNARTCSDVYCHGNFKSVGSPGTTWLEGNASNVPTWTNGSTAACGTCHGVTTGNNAGLGIPNASNVWNLSNESHVKHAGVAAANGNNYPCGFCHLGSYDATLSVGNGQGGAYESGTKVPGYTLHANGVRDMSSSTFYTAFTGTAGVRTAGAPQEGTCSGLYCHSDGWNTTRTVPDTGGIGTPTWGGASKSTITCTSCHNNGATPAPRHNSTSGNGEDHYVGDKMGTYGCEHCHQYTATTNPAALDSNSSADNTIKYSGKRHVNRWKNVSFGVHTANSGSGQRNYNRASNGRCYVDCHSKDHDARSDWYHRDYSGQWIYEP